MFVKKAVIAVASLFAVANAAPTAELRECTLRSCGFPWF